MAAHHAAPVSVPLRRSNGPICDLINHSIVTRGDRQTRSA